MKSINREIFRAYDIRGVVDRDFDPEWVERLGRACGTFFRARGWQRALVGHDCRATSPEYSRSLARGMNAAGVDAVLLGQVSTPMFYFAARHLDFQAGVMVTASHNPPDQNGFKVWGGRSTILGEDIVSLHDLMVSGEFASGPGLTSWHDILPAYERDLLSRVRLERPVRVVVDGGNGTSGEITARLLEQAGAEVVRLYCEPDGNFPNHHPDPVVEEYSTDLKARVLEAGAEVGVGLDGDGDRIGAVDEQGRLLFGDQLLAVYARELLREVPGATVLGDVKCSHLLFADIAAHGGNPVMCETGHSIVKARMLETGAALGGEMSGHMFFSHGFHGFDDATFGALRLVEILSRGDRPLSGLLDGWPETSSTPEIRMACPEAVKFEVVRRAREHFSKDHEVIDMDGVRVVFPDGWGLVRASNTQAVLVLRFEAESPERLQEIRQGMEEPLMRWIRELEA
ncbi:phosphomannomutase/phosphoglucomutase [Salidesulfovibrio onnuriiensis]|uniref:phosphomannomutase/phosphoglucomutase n=1 Tax=Salidesulfovibrio onnuriiensis TaxID=2583823 RepID=UPI0011CB1E3E|nr:phosphomannomutase/phosphoglucomutase [Salidesulfovibrio onnuriiensis]